MTEIKSMEVPPSLDKFMSRRFLMCFMSLIGLHVLCWRIIETSAPTVDLTGMITGYGISVTGIIGCLVYSGKSDRHIAANIDK